MCWDVTHTRTHTHTHTQDAHSMDPDFDQDSALFAVYDGHGGLCFIHILHGLAWRISTCIYMDLHGLDWISTHNSALEGATELKFVPFCSS